jgi:hypothetical protein
MARPNCPICHDHFTVGRLSVLSSELWEEPDIWISPYTASAVGRWALLAALIGGLLWLASGFAVVWPSLALCVGVLVEVVTYWDRQQVEAARQAATECWRAAYYCGFDRAVFIPGDKATYTPLEFAELLCDTPPVRGTQVQVPRAEPSSAVGKMPA